MVSWCLGAKNEEQHIPVEIVRKNGNEGQTRNWNGRMGLIFFDFFSEDVEHERSKSAL